jgi:predicted nuclease of predicted toxin-antitoxin system
MGPQDRLFIFLYTDEDVTPRLAELLRERGHEAESAMAAGTIGFSDEEQLSFAANRGWTILTCNRKDFSFLARQWQDAGREHAGIVISRQFSNRQTGELLRQTCSLIDSVSAEEMRNTVRNLQSYS